MNHVWPPADDRPELRPGHHWMVIPLVSGTCPPLTYDDSPPSNAGTRPNSSKDLPPLTAEDYTHTTGAGPDACTFSLIAAFAGRAQTP